MVIDILFLLITLLAVYKGWKQGAIKALCTFLSVFIGLLAALKLSAYVAQYLLEHTRLQAYALPFISFMLVMVVAILCVRFAGTLIDNLAKLVLLGMVNRVLGIAFYMSLYFICFSILLFYLQKMQLIQPTIFNNSITYAYIKNLGPGVVNVIGDQIPYFKGLFENISTYFDKAYKK